MKRIFLWSILTLLFTHSVIVSAWATPCQHSNVDPAVGIERIAVQDAMPCHQDDNQGKSNHCDGLCTCAFTCFYQTPIVKDEALFSNFNESSVLRAINNDELIKRSVIPPRRPPKILS